MNNQETAVNKFQPSGKVKQVKGSILMPENAGLRFILSINNTEGRPDENPLLPIFDKKWKKVREESRGWFATKTGDYKVGAINTTAVQSDVWVIHMLCKKLSDKNNVKSPVVLDVLGLTECLKKVASTAKYEKATVHVSTILTDHIPELYDLLVENLVKNGVSVYFYQES